MAFPIIPPGQYKAVITAPDGTSTSFAFTIPAPAVPVSVTLTPPSQSLPDNSPAGTKVGSIAVKMSDGSPFTGTLVINPSGMVGLSAGLNLVLVRALGAADDGAHSFTITATQNLVSAQAVLALNIAAVVLPPPPLPPTILINFSASPATVPAGATIVATVANGPGNPGDWLGVYAVGAPVGTANPASWKWLSTDGAASLIPPVPGHVAGTVHLVVPSQAGQYEARFFANNGLVVAAKSAAITVPAAPPTPVITLSPNAPQVSDTTPKGAVVSTYAITMSDGSPFTGTVAFGPPNFDSGGVFALVATTKTTGSIIVNPNGPGVGPNLTTITDHITLVATS